MKKVQSLIEGAFAERSTFSPQNTPKELKDAIETIFDHLDQGTLRVAEKIDGQWQTHEWIKKAILLYFATHDNVVIPAGFTQFYDKVPLKFQEDTAESFKKAGVRVVPHAIARRGAYLAPNTILMPSY